jgi:dipeptidyl aminopeptidase/acylaminoacyl peptidase
MKVFLENADATTCLVVTVRGDVGAVDTLPAPPSNATMDRIGAGGAYATDISVDSTGATTVWAVSLLTDKAAPVVRLNDQLRHVVTGKRVLLTYSSVDGAPLHAVLILPVGYRVGTRYPTVVWVYHGQNVRDTLLFTRGSPISLRQDVFTGHGYAVLVPSLPLPGTSEAMDEMLELQKGLYRAIDAAIATGVVDPNRIGVGGASGGGYATLALITQTTRFKAAASIDGISNFVDLYSTYGGSDRYDPAPQRFVNTWVSFWMETGLPSLHASPWMNETRYLRNSPYFYLDRVTTPLLLIHGDLDDLPIGQSEQVFTALVRQGKAARFVRYWGEGHGPQSPANIRDMWHQLFTWFDAYLTPVPTAEHTTLQATGTAGASQ